MVAFEPGPTRTFSCAGVQHRVGTFVHRLTGIVMHLVPGGAFVLGQDDALPRELPRQTCQLAAANSRVIHNIYTHTAPMSTEKEVHIAINISLLSEIDWIYFRNKQ